MITFCWLPPESSVAVFSVSAGRTSMRSTHVSKRASPRSGSIRRNSTSIFAATTARPRIQAASPSAFNSRSTSRWLVSTFPPATAGNPRPFGMPPFATLLSDEDVAAVISHIRSAWGNKAGAVSEFTVSQQRGSIGP